jgi:hypothetical protein
MFDVFLLDDEGYGADTIRERFPFCHALHQDRNVNSAVLRADTEWVWILSGHIDYSGFDFGFVPVPWQQQFTHVFTDNWGVHSTVLMPKHASEGIVVHSSPNKRLRCRADLAYVLDMGNVTSIGTSLAGLASVNFRYIGTHLQMIDKCAHNGYSKYFWVVSSCCDYSDFDFTFRPKPGEEYQLHCWASGTQKFGDTFFVNRNEFLKQGVKNLAWYKDINWRNANIKRWPWPERKFTGCLPNAIKATWKEETPYVHFNSTNTDITNASDVSLWDTKPIQLNTAAGASAFVPRIAKPAVKTQVYDYPNIDRKPVLDDKKMDVVFISYDEPEAEENFVRLQSRLQGRSGSVLHRIHGIKGIQRAYQEAARVSTTDWYYAVFAKTIVADEFTFDFVPDRLQEPKHYIFYAENLCNGLCYGHMGVKLYNVELALKQDYMGLDFTLSAKHAVIPSKSATVAFKSPLIAYRTAFREAAKLARFQDEKPTIEGAFRLHVWQNGGYGENGDWAMKGAQDGVTFYRDHPADLDSIQDWNFLQTKFGLRI